MESEERRAAPNAAAGGEAGDRERCEAHHNLSVRGVAELVGRVAWARVERGRCWYPRAGQVL